MALDKLTQINSGMPVHNVLRTQFDWTALQVSAIPSSETGDDEVGSCGRQTVDNAGTLFFFSYSLNRFSSGLGWQNSMDLCKVAAMGHSFGGATVIESLSKEVKFKYEI